MKQSIQWLGAIALAAAFGTTSAGAAVVLDTNSTGRYNNAIGTLLDTSGVNDPFPCANGTCGDVTISYASAPDLSAASAVLGNWLVNPAAPGASWSATGQFIPTNWTPNDETAIIYEFNAGAGLQNLSLQLGSDNGIFVWLDGVFLFGARAAGGSFAGEYSLGLPNLSGTHYLQVLREDHGGVTGYDLLLTGDRVNNVPEPTGLALAVLGMLAACVATRRRRAAAPLAVG